MRRNAGSRQAKPHAAHHHEHVEMVMIREGLMEVPSTAIVAASDPGRRGSYLGAKRARGGRTVGDTMDALFLIAIGQERS